MGQTAHPHQKDREQQADGFIESNMGGGSSFFSAVPRRRKCFGSSPTETTQMHLDRSKLLEDMIEREYAGAELSVLGELQIAYVAFLLGQNCDAFDQWRTLLELLCSCEAAVLQRPDLFSEMLRTFFAQLSQAPNDLFEDDLTSGNFMGGCAIS